MARYILKRILLMIPVVLGISLLVFSMLELSPGDPAQIILGMRATPEALENLREEMGLNQPFWTRYFNYIINAVQGDFGTSWRTNLPVFNEIMARLLTTVRLALGAMVLVVAIGIPVGILSAVKQYSLLDNMALTGALILSSMPAFWLGTLLILLFALKLSWLPAMGNNEVSGYILPWITLAASYLATLVRMTRSSMLEVIRADYIKMARAKGANERQVILRHALRNALLPIVTIVGMNFAGLLGGTVIIEQVFTLNGLGSLAITSVRQLDVPMVMAEVLFIALITSVINLIVDVLYASLNPRMTVYEIIAEPLIAGHLRKNSAELEKDVFQMMDTVGLAARLVNAYPHELDGGRRQRIGIARALVLQPEFIVCDEPVSALDVSIQAQILNLLMDLQRDRGLAYMFITHDLSVVKHISDEIAVMYLGRCVERGPAKAIFANPLHPYTQALLQAIPVPNLSRRGMKREILKGEVSSPIDPKPGCRFAARCPKATDACRKQDVPLTDRGEGHFCACLNG